MLERLPRDGTTNTGNNAADATLLGCDASGASCTPRCVPVTASCPTASSVGVAGTATYSGVYTTNANPTYWTISATGYSHSTGAVRARRLTATVPVTTTTNLPANVAVWNHVISTAPPGSGCEMDLSGTNVSVDVPLYVTGDLCLSGMNAAIQESAGGQPVDLNVVGKLVLAGTNSKIGTDAARPITSGAVGGGCATSIGGAPVPCTSLKYWVRTPHAVQTLTPPTADPDWYANAEPGPRHPCLAGTSPAPLSSAAFDTDTIANGSAATFNLTPSTSYKCVSSAGTGQLSWNATTRVLTISGTVYFDGSIQITQSGTYSGLGTIYANGTISLVGTNTTFCATSGCNFSAWQPNSTMLILAALGAGEISLSGTNTKFQGGLFTAPTATIALAGTNVAVQGPIIGGRFAWGTNTQIEPLPTLNNLPPGAPLAVNAHAVPGTLTLTSG